MVTTPRSLRPWLLPLLLVAGCSSESASGGGSSGDPTPGAGGVPGAPAVGSDALTLAAPESGFQLRTLGTVIDPGVDTEYCEIVEVPGAASDEYYVSRTETEMVAHSHHLIVSSVDEVNPSYAGLEVGSIVPCFGAFELAGFSGTAMIGGSQLPYLDRTLPKGVGMKLHGGQKLIFDYHYYNTTEEPIHTGHRMNFHTVDAAEIQHLGHSMAFVNLSIDTPPGETKQFLGECDFTDDVMVGGLTRHTHQWGKDFSVWFKGGERDAEHIWTSGNYESDSEYAFAEPVLMKQGTGFRFECDFENDTASNLRFGLKATDEMCILFGLWWEPGTTAVPRQACMMQTIDADGVARGTAIDPTALAGLVPAK